MRFKCAPNYVEKFDVMRSTVLHPLVSLSAICALFSIGSARAAGGLEKCLLGELEPELQIPLSNDEKIQLLIQFRQWSDDGFTARQKAWIRDLITSLSNKLDGKAPMMHLPEFDYTEFKGEKEDLDLIRKEAEEAGPYFGPDNIVGPFRRFICHAILEPKPEAVEEIAKAKSIEEISRIFSQKLG
jgi:hypothetical protein